MKAKFLFFMVTQLFVFKSAQSEQHFFGKYKKNGSQRLHRIPKNCIKIGKTVFDLKKISCLIAFFYSVSSIVDVATNQSSPYDSEPSLATSTLFLAQCVLLFSMLTKDFYRTGAGALEAHILAQYLYSKSLNSGNGRNYENSSYAVVYFVSYLVQAWSDKTMLPIHCKQAEGVA